MKYYLAYGSNLNKCQMSYRCPGARPIGVAFIPNYRLAFKGHGYGNYLTIVKSKDHKVPVAVWEVDEDHEYALDRYEGYPSFYKKHTFKSIDVRMSNGSVKQLECFAYIMNDRYGYGMPSGSYYMTCSEGYRDFHLDDNWLGEALEFTSKMQNRQNKQIVM